MPSVASSARRCTCWVSTRDPQTQFELRYGAHSLDCPAYRQSADPVDRQYDNMLRHWGERGCIGRPKGGAA